MGFYRRIGLTWRDWNPGLDNDQRTLGEVLDTLPGAAPLDIPWFVRLLENPGSPLALPGAISLDRHDALHVVLGRGLLAQDEAFVIGFTMGADRRALPRHRSLFRVAARYLYRSPYRLQPGHLIAFDLAFGLGRELPAGDLHRFPFEQRRDAVLRDLRRELGLSVHRLHALYRHERALLPHTRASRRLDLDYRGVDPSLIEPP